MSGVADLAPYSANGQRLALTPIRFGPGPGGSTALSTVAQLDGAVPEWPGAGAAPADHRPDRPRRQLRLRHVLRGRQLQLSPDEHAPARAPTRAAGLPDRPRDHLEAAGRPGARERALQRPRAERPARQLAAASRRPRAGRSSASSSASTNLGMRLGRPTSPVLFDAARLTGTFVGAGMRGNFAGAKATDRQCAAAAQRRLGHVAAPQQRPQRRQRADGLRPRRQPALLSARERQCAFHACAAIMSARPARCAIRRPERLSPNVTIEHRLSTGAGHALLDVPGLTFGPNLQPEEITRLTEGVIALVNGTISGHGRIDWTRRRQSHFDRRLLDRRTWTSRRRSGPVSGHQRHDPLQRSARPTRRRARR